MSYAVAGYGAVSAAGLDGHSQGADYQRNAPRWRTDEQTGLPVYAVGDLPRHPAIDSFSRDRQPDRATALALHAAEQAVQQAGWAGKDFAVLVGCSRGPTESWESTYTEFLRSGQPPLRTSPQTTLGSLAFALADFFGSGSLSTGASVTCSSGFHALYHGMALLRSGMADRVLVGGTEAALTPYTLRQLEALRVYAPRPEDPARPACRPLATPPSGMVVGEGAAFLALERQQNHHQFSLTGLGAAREMARSSTGITRDGAALQRSMRQAIRDSGGPPDFIIAHAPGTARGDAAEKAAIGAVFGLDHPPVTSFKWATGHTFGASGPLALVAGLTVLRKGKFAALPYLPDRPAPADRMRSFLVNATGFGGNAVSVQVSLR